MGISRQWKNGRRDDSGAVENRAYFIRDRADSIRDPLKKERRGLEPRLPQSYTKLTPFVVRGPCASQGSLDQKTSNQAKWVLEFDAVKMQIANVKHSHCEAKFGFRVWETKFGRVRRKTAPTDSDAVV